jgi:preprotein translocase subunit YajC
MDLLISDAMAQSGGGAPAGGLVQFLPLIIIGVIFYFLLIRPQQKRAKQHREMVAALNRGDEVLTGGGMVGRITDIGADFVSVEVADNVEIRLQKSSVYQVLPKGTWKQKLEKPGSDDEQGGKKN